MEETIKHLLFCCDWSECVWFGALDWKIDKGKISSLGSWWRDSVNLLAKEDGDWRNTKIRMLELLWFMQKQRFDAVFAHRNPNPLVMVGHLNSGGVKEKGFSRNLKTKIGIGSGVGADV